MVYVVILNKKPLCGMGRLGLVGARVFSRRASAESLAALALLTRPVDPDLASVRTRTHLIHLFPLSSPFPSVGLGYGRRNGFVAK